MKKISFIHNFIRCGLIGWCLECFWTGLVSFFQKQDKKLTCHTSILMFPIYGMAAFIAPFSRLFHKKSLFFRGSLYTLLIYITEYLTGFYLKKKQACPWDYSQARYNIKGLIRLDYAPVWFATGLLYEHLLSKNTKH
ncbi:putative ABC transporter permease [Acetivibrio ethanolgignens]|uniref:Uncharacterized protein n=1 Tax=Acetivibrio ethanolgignens TaxID=290052 RepID=A0A0V8QCN1_9FIRM|nr:hypothetical protein [Acetivibrio ethanolgignens]KSV58306.1 hypothetical protein ASU35_13210 [Acetivibrio ethanolgignens]